MGIDDTIEGFRCSLGLVAKMLVRTSTEGSTAVMKAIDSNSTKMLKTAIGCAPRGERAVWAMHVQVETQNISPLSWAIECGALEAALAMIDDPLTFRADRDRYYYGMDQVFQRHRDMILKLTNGAPALVSKLLDGLVWRSRTTEKGQRRVNVYFKYLLVDENRNFSPTLSCIAKSRDPVLVLLSDTVWLRVACRAFLYRKTWFLVTLLAYVVGQSILKHLNQGSQDDLERNLAFGFRAFIYTFSMTQLIYTHAGKWWQAHKSKLWKTVFGCITLPAYLGNWQDASGFVLMLCLVLALALKPILWCISNNDDKFFNARYNDLSKEGEFTYSLFSMVAMLLYYILLVGLAVLSTKVLSYMLVCIRMLSKVCLFLLALVASMMAFSSSVSVLKHDENYFAGIHNGFLTLLEMTMKMFDGEHYGLYEDDPMVIVCVFGFLFLAIVLLVNMLIAQLTYAYGSVYVDMVGYARLPRVEIIVSTMPQVTDKRWITFLNTRRMDQKLEFGAGDVGVAGRMQVLAPASANPTVADTIKRLGGSTSVEMQWPQEDEGDGDETDRFDPLEKLIQRTLKRLSGSGCKRGKGDGTGTGSRSGSGDMGEGEDYSSGSEVSDGGNAEE